MASGLVTQVRNPHDEDGDEVELQQDNHVQYVDPNAPKPHRDSINDLKLEQESCWAGFVRGLVKCFKCFKCSCMPCCGPSEKEVADMRRSISYSVKPQQVQHWLLPEMIKEDLGKKTLVLDLDETLVHSSFKPVPNADFVISIELEKEVHHVYVLKRPGVDEFLLRVAQKYEVVVFTASLNKYADPLLDILDPQRVIRARLFRESCVQHYGNYVKDLSQLGREMNKVIIIDNSPYSYIFQPDNAIPCSSWFNDQDDRQLLDLIPILDTIADCDDVVQAIANKAFSTRHMQTFHSIDASGAPVYNPNSPITQVHM